MQPFNEILEFGSLKLSFAFELAILKFVTDIFDLFVDLGSITKILVKSFEFGLDKWGLKGLLVEWIRVL